MAAYERKAGHLVIKRGGSNAFEQVTEEEAMKQVRSGSATIPHQDEVDEYNRVEQFGGTGQQALAAGEAAYRGLTLGLAGEGIGTEEEIRGRAKTLKEESPGIAAAAEIAPDIALGLATGGASALVTGAAKVGLKQAAKLGVKQTIKAAGKAGTAAALAGESVAGGAVTASQQAFEEGRTFLHEDVGRDIKNIAIFGGLNLGLGVGGAALGRGVRRLGKGKKAVKESAEVVDDIAATAERKAGPDEIVQATEKDAGQGVIANAEREATHTDAEGIVKKAMLKDVPEQEVASVSRSAMLSRNASAIRETAQKEMRPVVNRLLKVAGDTQSVDKKLTDGMRHLSKNAEGQMSAARGIGEAAAELAGKLRGNARKYADELDVAAVKLTDDEIAAGATQFVPKKGGKPRAQFRAKPTQQLTIDLVEAAKGLGKVTSGRQAVHKMDKFRQMMQKTKLSLERGAQKSRDPQGYIDDIALVEHLQEKNRLLLEDTNIMGEFGNMQKAYNATWHDKYFAHAKVFNEALLKRTGTDYSAKPIMEAWEASLDHIIKTPGEGNRRHVMGMLDALDEMADNQAKYGSAKAGTTDAMKGDTEKVRRILGLADEAGTAEKRFEALGQVPVVGGAIKGAYTGDLIGSFQRLAGATDAAAERSIDDWIRGSVARGRASGKKERKFGRLIPTPRLPALNPAVARRGFTRSMQEFMGDDESPQSAYKKTVDVLQDDESFLTNMSDQFQDLADVSPQGIALLASHTIEARQFLLGKMPPSIAVSMSKPGGYPPSEDAIADWAVYVNAVRNPMGILKNIGTGDIRVQEVEVLKSLSATQDLYEKIQMTLLDRLSRQSEKEPLEDQMVMRLSMLFDLDGAGTPAFSRSAAETSKQAQPPPNQPGGKAKPVEAGSRIDPASIGQSGATYGTQG